MNSQKEDNICLFGAGGHGRVVATQMRRAGYFNLCFGDANMKPGILIAGVPVLYSELETVTNRGIIITIGDNKYRRTLYEQATQRALKITVFIAEPKAYHTENPPGAGSMILHGAIVNDNARIGSCVIVNTSAVIEHDVELGDFSHISPGAVLAGGCKIGANCWIGANATVIPGVRVAAGVTVGAGSVVLGNIDEAGTYAGCPIRRVK